MLSQLSLESKSLYILLFAEHQHRDLNAGPGMLSVINQLILLTDHQNAKEDGQHITCEYITFK